MEKGQISSTKNLPPLPPLRPLILERVDGDISKLEDGLTKNNIKALRYLTGCGMMDCKRALLETDCNVAEAKEWLKGMATGFGRYASNFRFYRRSQYREVNYERR